MASKSVSPVDIKIKVTGVEQLAALKSSFRDLGKQTKLSDKDIVQATEDIKNFAAAAGNSEATIAGQIKALKGLQSQTSLSSSQYQSLGKDIAKLGSILDGTTEEIESQKKAIIRSATAVGSSSRAVSSYINQLKALKGQTREGSKAFNDISEDVEKLSGKLDQLKAKDLQNLKVGFQGVKGAAVTAVRGAISEFNKLAIESKAALAGVAGLGAAGVAGATLGPLSSIPSGLSSVLGGGANALTSLKSSLGGLPLGFGGLEQIISPSVIGNLQQASQKFAEMQSQLGGLDQAFDAINSTVVAFGPSATAAATAATVSIALIYNKLQKKAQESRQDLEKTFKPIGEDVQGLIERLKKLGDSLSSLSTSKINELRSAAKRDFDFAPAGSPLSRSAASRLVGLEAVSRQESQDQADVLEEYRQRVRATDKSVDRLNERLSYLREGLKTVDTSTKEGSQTYAQVQRQIISLDAELQGIANSYRNVADMARQASTAQGVYANTSVGSNYLRRGIVRQQEAARAELGAAVRAGVASTQLALPAAGQTTAPGTGLERSGRAEPLIPESSRGFAQESFAKLQGPKQYLPGPALPPGFAEGLRQKNISETESLRKLNEEKEVAKKLNRELGADVSKAKAANNGSISGINNFRAALEKQRNELPINTKRFKALTRQIEELDRQSEKASKGMRRRKFSPGKAAQVAGATISGGIFGGPEGLLGGAIGGAVGGVGGSFAGAALGAQVGQLRQQLGGFAEYAAQIDKLKISLKGITQSGLSAGQGLAQYNLALTTAADVTESLNVPQDTAIAGITRLTAAVKGAGGNVTDASIAFKNINSAIIATGGGAEQVEGAVTALVQIFSKGKVSAEEINQIAERLPGTFNLFAEAAGKTGPQLADSLKKGEVGLNDLQKFVKLLGDDFGDLAEKIADSPQAAGARLKVVTDQLRKDIGDALQPIGAEFQQAFAEFISDIGPDLVKTAKAVGEGMRFIVRNREAIGTAAALAAKLFLVSKAMKLIAGLKFATIASLAGTGTAAKITGDVSGVAAGKVALLGKALRSLAAIGIVTVGVEYVVNNAKVLASNTKRLEELRGRRDKGAAARFEGETYEGGLARQKAAKQTIGAIDKEMPGLEKKIALYEAVGRAGSIFVRGEKKRRTLLRATRIEAFQNLLLPLPEKQKEEAQTVFNNLLEETKDKSGGGGGGGGGGKAEKARKSLLDSIRDQGKLVFFTEARLKNELDIGEAQNENNRLQVNKLNNEKIAIDFAEQAAGVELQYRDALRAAQGEKNEQAIVAEESLKREVATNKLLAELEGARTAEAQRFRIEKEAIAKASEDELFNLRDQLGLVSNEDRIDRFRQSRIDAGDPNAEQQTDLFRQKINPTLQEGLGQNIRQMKKDLEELLNPVNQIVGAANAIGDSFAQSFKSVIDGSATAQEALASFFQNLSNYFLDMATQIIAEMIKIAILNAVTGLLPGGSDVGGIPFLSDAPSITGNKIGDFGGGTPLFAKGGVFAKNEIVPYAKGGIFNKPTMFAYANGGAGNFGLLGEAGPEAIMPLSRGSDGKLGVKAAGGGTVINITNNIAEGKNTSRGNGSDSQGISQLSKMMVAVIQREQRPGGVLNR